MQRRTLLQYIGATTIGLGLGALPRPASAATVIKFATRASKASLWGKAFAAWSKAVSDKSGGALQLEIFYNGLQGTEVATVAKLKADQLDGAALSGVGLGKIFTPILALQMPGLFSTWTKLDAARSACQAEFDKGCTDAGFRLSGWGDVGIVRSMSKGFAVTVPDNLKGKKPAYDIDNPIPAAVYSAIGGVSSAALGIVDVLPTLNTGATNAIATSCLLAEQFAWSTKLDHITSAPIGMAIGAIVFRTKALDALSADLRKILLDTCTVTTKTLQAKVRAEDDASFVRLKSKMAVTNLSADDETKWRAIFQQARQKLAQGTFPPEIVTKLETLP